MDQDLNVSCHGIPNAILMHRLLEDKGGLPAVYIEVIKKLYGCHTSKYDIIKFIIKFCRLLFIFSVLFYCYTV